MANKEKILSLCENCSKMTKRLIDADGFRDFNASLNQNLFILDTAIDQLYSAVKEEFLSCSEEKALLPTDLKKAIEAYEISIIKKAVEAHGSKRKAATALNVEPSTLIKKCQRYGI